MARLVGLFQGTVLLSCGGELSHFAGAVPLLGQRTQLLVTRFEPEVEAVLALRDDVADAINQTGKFARWDVGRHVIHPDLIEQARFHGNTRPLLRAYPIRCPPSPMFPFEQASRDVSVKIFRHVLINAMGIIRGQHTDYTGCMFGRNAKDWRSADRGEPRMATDGKPVIVLSQSGGNQVYHFVAENLIRLAYIMGRASPRTWEASRYLFHIVAEGPKSFAWQRRLEFLELAAGATEAQIITGNIWAEAAIYPPNVHCLHPDRQETQWLQSHLRLQVEPLLPGSQQVALPDAPMLGRQLPRLCIVLRPEEQQDWAAAVVRVAKNLSFEVMWQTGIGTIVEQAACFYSASVVSASHGAGEVFAFFAPRLSTLVEVFPEDRLGRGRQRFRRRHCFMYLAAYLEMNYFGLAWPQPRGMSKFHDIFQKVGKSYNTSAGGENRIIRASIV